MLILLLIVAIVLIAANVGFADKILDTAKVAGNVSKKTFAIVTFLFQALVFLWYFWLLRRATVGKSREMLIMILLALGLISSVYSLIMGLELLASFLI